MSPPGRGAGASQDPAASGTGGGAGGGPRVALVHDWLTGMRGGERVLEAIAALYPGAPIHTLFHFPGTVSRALEAHPIVTSFLQGWPGVRRHYRRYLPLFPAAIEDFDLGGYELVVSTSHAVAKGAIPAPGAFHVCYCHTPMRYAWDQEHAYFPDRRGLTARLRGLALSALRTWDAASTARVDLLVANSRFVASRIARYYGRAAEVIPPPVDVEFFTPGDGARGGYCVAVSALAPYKRLEVAIDACARAGAELRIVGDGPERARLARRAKGTRTRLLGRLGREALRAELRGAACMVQPGIEDFGIAAVESLACGTPVVALGRGGVLDAVEDGVHGVLYQVPGDPAGEAAAHAAALAAAIDKSARIRWNTRDLRGWAEAFSTSRFTDRFASLLAARVPGRGASEGAP